MQQCDTQPFSLSNREHIIRNRCTTFQHPQATKRQASRLHAPCIVLVTLPNDEPIAEGSCGPTLGAATAGNLEVVLTDKAPSRAADHFASPLIIQGSKTLGHLTPEEGEAPLFENLKEKLECLQQEYARLE